MKKKSLLIVMLVLVLAFGMSVIGCDEGDDEKAVEGGGENWENVTSLTQLNGTWKNSHSERQSIDNINNDVVIEITITINASIGTMSSSRKTICTLSGSGLTNTIWESLKNTFSYGTYVFDDSAHSFTQTESFPSGPINMADLNDIKINQNGTKIKVPADLLGPDSPESIFTKQ